jgi:hypothetical protein
MLHLKLQVALDRPQFLLCQADVSEALLRFVYRAPCVDRYGADDTEAIRVLALRCARWHRHACLSKRV